MFLKPVLFSVLDVLPVDIDKSVSIAPRMLMSHPHGMRDLVDHCSGSIACVLVQADILSSALPPVGRTAGFAVDEADVVALI
jgi:hypothetical protein